MSTRSRETSWPAGIKSLSAVWLFPAVSILLFVRLGAAELWTLEGRWAAICDHILSSGDYLHPYLFGEPYYDKPLLSYWLMIAAARVLGTLDETAMRIPSALAGTFSVWCVYRLGKRRFDHVTGLVAGLVLATSWMFVFWARVASPDMLNVAGTIAAVTWYFERRDEPGFVTDTVLLVLLALTALVKGLIGPAVAVLVLIPDLARDGQWRRMLRPSLGAAGVLATAIYLAPFCRLQPDPARALRGERLGDGLSRERRPLFRRVRSRRAILRLFWSVAALSSAVDTVAALRSLEPLDALARHVAPG